MNEPTKGTTESSNRRAIDYDRTNKSPHSFRYKRGHAFVTKAECVGTTALSRDVDGALVVGPAPTGSTADVAILEAGQVELVSVRKRPNGRTGITFKHSTMGEIVAYDARTARSVLRSAKTTSES